MLKSFSDLRSEKDRNDFLFNSFLSNKKETNYINKMEYYQIALDEAFKSKIFMKHGAVLVRGNEIVSSAPNNEKYHAEVQTVRQCLQRVLQGSFHAKVEQPD